ncbi:hypothetical protein QE390_001958 [Siphonobacter sp. SORGH_AS 1065]|nr:hypothetical protein [Siphonobacter sp. SORGH_AS_1065]
MTLSIGLLFSEKVVDYTLYTLLIRTTLASTQIIVRMT